MKDRLSWLQWAPIDLATGRGGVEAHARCLARELEKMGVNAVLSSDPADLKKKWDVVHTHGSLPLPKGVKFPAETTRVVTLHGTTLGRMAAAREWAWLGGYSAAFTETESIIRADVVLSVHPKLHLYRLAQRMGKKTAVCGNGWDTDEKVEALPGPLADALEKTRGRVWLYIGRDGDPVKGADRFKKVVRECKEIPFWAVPGSTLKEVAGILSTGPLTHGQVRSAMEQASGLVLTSRYEGLPLVILEALASGIRVVSTPAGGVTTLPDELMGLHRAKGHRPRELSIAIKSLGPLTSVEREAARKHNRGLLKSWHEVAEIALKSVRN